MRANRRTEDGAGIADRYRLYRKKNIGCVPQWLIEKMITYGIIYVDGVRDLVQKLRHKEETHVPKRIAA